MAPVDLIAPELAERDLAIEAIRCAYDEARATLLHDDDRPGRRRVVERLSEALERLGAHPAHDGEEIEHHPSISDWERVDRERQVDEEQERDIIEVRERAW